MQIVTVGNSKKKKADRYISVFLEHKFYFALLMCLVLGMLVGALSVRLLDDSGHEFIRQWFASFISFRLNSSFWKILFNSFLTFMVYLLAVSVSSFGVGGIVIVPLLMFFKGFGSCLLAGVLYREFSLNGIAFADLILLPSVLAADVALLYLCESGIGVSKKFLSCINDSDFNNSVLKSECVYFFKRLLIVLVAVLFISVVESAFNVCFIGYFNF